MPKVKPMGSPEMKASQEAKRAGEMTMKDTQSIARRIRALCKLAGYDNYAQFAGALGMSERRIKYILTNPECISISEAVRIQKMADAYDHFKVFDTISVSYQAKGQEA